MAVQLPLKNQKPGPRLAFLSEAEPEALAECLVAFANGDGGLIVLGLDENGRPSETIWEEEAEGALRAAAALCRPPVTSRWQPVETAQGKTFVGVQVNRSPELHSLEDGRVFIRSGSENRLLSGGEIGQLAASKTAADFEADHIAGATADDFDQNVLAEYLAKREARGASPVSSLPALLFEIGAIDAEGRPTVAGILLFGKNPRAFLPQSGVVFVKFPGPEPRSESGEAGYGRREEVNGPLARVIERTWNIIWEEMHRGAVVNSLQREELTEYPPFAVREALVNAVAHRDYRLRGRRIEVRMYSDRMEVISPGDLPGYITVDNIVEEHFSRNPRLVNGLFQWGYIEELGLGIDRMIEEMVQSGHPPPQFKATPYSFTVLLANARERASVPRWTRSMNERQARALTYVRENGSITNREYQRLCPDVSAETLRLDLADLVERSILLKIGSKKGTYYILK
ncbi:MAG: putative DNA binding domain-containing protein [Chloroflexi bacterium]|nr:putative DNA binding domain-containing protein [Chloroflexota bacterium]MCI0580435.1 putative DNA binding domain-containing protein [Chloroflexota bacterium]MCI0643932.1 putative DNA binding domain-containing protein [Chloroflexota bacterium]MCI0729158.1 putative DNA binding domain-containing protein [Chloroflexota bacterium]